MKQKPKKQQLNADKPQDKDTLAPVTGSASAAGQLREMPQNFYRLVMQLEATPKNSELINAALAALAKLQPSPEGYAAVIKLETVNMRHYLRPRTPNIRS